MPLQIISQNIQTNIHVYNYHTIDQFLIFYEFVENLQRNEIILEINMCCESVKKRWLLQSLQ